MRPPHGTESVSEMSPKRIKTIREKMVALGWCRNVVNNMTNRLKRVYRWGAEEELVPGEVIHAITCVRPLGRAGERDGEGEAGACRSRRASPAPSSRPDLGHLPAHAFPFYQGSKFAHRAQTLNPGRTGRVAVPLAPTRTPRNADRHLLIPNPRTASKITS
jgi:hypothetical protein